MLLVTVFHYTDPGKLPRLSEEERRAIRAKFLEILRGYPDVTFYGTWVNSEGRGICLWEAPGAEVVKEIVIKALGSPPVDLAIEVKKILISTPNPETRRGPRDLSRLSKTGV